MVDKVRVSPCRSFRLTMGFFYSGAQALEAPQRRTMGYGYGFGYGVSVRRDCRDGGGEAGVFMQFSLARNGVAALHLATSVFLTGNHKGGFKGDFMLNQS